jgi:hypothetical protein
MDITKLPLKVLLNVEVYDTLDPHTSDLIISFENAADKYTMVPYEYLDDPNHKRPIREFVSILSVSNRIRFVHGKPTFKPSEKNLAKCGHSLRDLLQKDSSDQTLLELAGRAYAQWSPMVPLFRDVTFKDLSLVIRYSNFLENFEFTFKYQHIFVYPLNFEASEKFVVTAGVKDYFRFGGLGVEKGFWKIFWAAVDKKLPYLNRPVWWTMRLVERVGPLDAYTIHFTWKESGVEVTKRVTFPKNANVWSVILYLVSRVPMAADCVSGSIANGPSNK